MSSDLVVQSVIIDEINPHPNADKLELAIVGGWQVVVGKGDFEPGSLVIHVPPDTIIPEELGKKLGVWDYTSNGRVKQIKLRKEPSFGFLFSPISAGISSIAVGKNVAGHLGITKYEPPVRGGGNGIKGGNPSTELHAFPKYTDIQNLRHYPNTFADGEPVVVTEKIHGTNSRIGYVNGIRLAGSHRLRRRDPSASLLAVIGDWMMVISEAPRGRKLMYLKRAWRQIKGRLFGTDTRTDEGNGTYWFPWSIPGMKEMMDHLSSIYSTVVLYGEIYGEGIQSMTYGKTAEDPLGYVAFDIKGDGQYLDYATFNQVCNSFNIPMAPLDGVTNYDLKTIAAISQWDSKMPGTTHIREGVVVRPIEERCEPRHGRAIMKYISDKYLFDKHTDYTEE